MVEGMSFLIGACKIVPPSAKAAVLLVLWFYGAIPGAIYEEYKEAYIATTSQEFTDEVEACWTPGAKRAGNVEGVTEYAEKAP